MLYRAEELKIVCLNILIQKFGKFNTFDNSVDRLKGNKSKSVSSMTSQTTDKVLGSGFRGSKTSSIYMGFTWTLLFKNVLEIKIHPRRSKKNDYYNGNFGPIKPKIFQGDPFDNSQYFCWDINPVASQQLKWNRI